MIQQIGKASDLIRAQPIQDWERMLLLVEVYQLLARASLVLVLQARGFKPVDELEALPFIHLATLASYTDKDRDLPNRLWARLQRRVQQGHRFMMLDIPI